MIVDHGPDDDGSEFYADCSLVCRSLRGRAQNHLYFKIELYSSERIDELLEIIRNNSLIARHIRQINTTSQQLIENYGFDIPLATLFLLIKEHSPHAPLGMCIVDHTDDIFEHDSSPERHLSPEGLVSCLSQVRYLLVRSIEEFPAVILFSLEHLDVLCLERMSFDPELHVIEQRQLLQLTAPVLRSLTTLQIADMDFFPSILLSSFEALTTLSIRNVRFAKAAVVLQSPRPQITHIELSDLGYRTVTRIVDSLVDVTHLIEFVDGTSPVHYQDYDSEESAKISRAVQYVLRTCKHSLETLSLTCCASLLSGIHDTLTIVVKLVTEIYTNARPQVVLNLSQIPNLKNLTLDCNCSYGEDVTKLPLYLRGILQTIALESTFVNRVTINIRVSLEPVFTDIDRLVHLKFSEPPRVFMQDAWIDIKQVFTALADKTHLVLVLFVKAFGDDNTAKYKHHVAPDIEATIFLSAMTHWTQENLIPRTGRCSFFLTTMLEPVLEDIAFEDEESGSETSEESES